MSYRRGIGATATEDAEAQTLLDAMLQQRGYTAIPSRDLRDYVQTQITTVGIGVVAGVFIGAILGPAALTIFRR
ncbi:MAG TPA: hypothetical protein VIY27_02075 [Myxococcota bacterium]